MPLRYFLSLYFVVYFLVALVWRTYLVWRKTGINPVVLKHTDDAHGFIGRASKVLLALTAAAVLIYSCLPNVYPYLTPVTWLDRGWLRSTGIALLIASLLWTILAQAHLGSSWRIGIDTEHKTQLVQRGVFSISRNPIFTGMMVTLLGFVFVTPNMVTVLVLVLGVVLINIQVRLEEEYLKSMHGDEYIRYSQRVRRWI